MKEIFSKRLASARKLAGLSLRALTARMDGYVSHQALDSYEKGASLPGSDVLLKLSAALNVSIDYFFKPFEFSLQTVEFRKSSKIKSEKRKDILIQGVIAKYENYYEIEEILRITAEFKAPLKNNNISNTEDIETAAEALRNEWNLGFDAIPNLIETLENNNIKVIEHDSSWEANEFSGLAGYINGRPIIALNAKLDIVRKRFTALHELAHLLLDFDPSLSEREIEKLCHAFAGAVLFPKSAANEYFPETRTVMYFQELIEIKELYGISVSALVMRLHALGILNDDDKNQFFRDLKSNNNYLDESALGEYFGVEKSSRVERLVLRALSEEIITHSKAAALLGIDVTALRNKLKAI